MRRLLSWVAIQNISFILSTKKLNDFPMMPIAFKLFLWLRIPCFTFLQFLQFLYLVLLKVALVMP